jgi:hypothetical protein
MTDYRLRNHDLLYADSGRRPLSWKDYAIFGAIAATVVVGVISYLADHVNGASGSASPNATARQAAPPAVVAKPVTTGSGS